MENIAPPLKLILFIQRQMDRGQSLRGGILQYLKANEDEFAIEVQNWLQKIEQDSSTDEILSLIQSLYRRELLRLLERGLKGASIHGALKQLEEEIVLACEDEIQNKMVDLPYRTMIPLLLFQFPAFLLLLLGPLMMQLLSSLNP